MTLVAGMRLGPYEIQSALGAGGMGEVYRGRDTRLKREVALKILPEAVAADVDRLARFQREAEVLAALNHPNIAAIYGLEESDGIRALVMELVEGETLADRIARGAIPLDDALPIAKQIAEALEAAHDQGIVHRDLKPANIKIRPDGTVKVLDFGLAKLAESAGSGHPAGGSPLSMSPTITSPALMTGIGVLLGTAAYMSPEQARGRPADKRSDIWAFGCVLYEMLTGRRAFPGDDIAETLAAVIKSEPDWDARPGRVPLAVRALLQRCLAKNPKQRMRDIGDVRIELESARDDEAAHSSFAGGSDTSSRRWITVTGWALAAIASLVAAMLAVADYGRPSPILPEPITFDLFPPENATFGNSAVVSPDGRRVAFVARSRDGRFQIWVRSLESSAARALAGTDDVGNGPLFWSPDSRFIAFTTGGFVKGRLKKIDASGGPALILADLNGTYRGGTWGSSGKILFAVGGKGILMVSDEGGTPSPVTAAGRETPVLPAFLPDGRHFVFTRVEPGTAVGGLFVGSLDADPDQSAKQLLANQAYAIFASSPDAGVAYLLFLRESTLMAQPFDAERLEPAGAAVPLAEDVVQTVPQPFSASTTGTLTFRRASDANESRLTWFDRQGKPVGQLGPPGRYNDIRLSPDGKTLVLDALNQQSIRHIWAVDLRRDAFSLLNAGSNGDTGQTISPDGRIAFTSASGDVYAMAVSGAGEPELLVKSATVKHPNDWSRDGRFIVYDDHQPTRRQDLYILPMSGDRKPVPYLVTQADETEAAFSPDGRWIAYSSDESGTRDVYVRDFAPGRVPAAGSVKVLISTAGGYKPRWHPNGRELFYLALDGTMMSVPVTVGATFEPGIPVALFKTNTAGFFPYDVSAEGRFVVNTLPESASVQSPITVVLNWQSLLKK